MYLNLNIDDDCPIRYDDGRNPWRPIDEFLFYYATGTTNVPSIFVYVGVIYVLLNIP